MRPRTWIGTGITRSVFLSLKTWLLFVAGALSNIYDCDTLRHSVFCDIGKLLGDAFELEFKVVCINFCPITRGWVACAGAGPVGATAGRGRWTVSSLQLLSVVVVAVLVFFFTGAGFPKKSEIRFCTLFPPRFCQ